MSDQIKNDGIVGCTAGLGDTAAGAAVALLDMQRALMWMEHENRLAEREERLGGWLSDHSEAMRYWNAEYDKARAGVSPNKKLCGDAPASGASARNEATPKT